MSKPRPPEEPAQEASMLLGRRLSTAIVLFHAAVAETLGLNLTDYKCLELLLRRQAATPGQLALEAGLSSATTTLVLDRLEGKGLVSRAPDPSDRRRTLLHARLTPELTERFERTTRGMRDRMQDLAGAFSDAELEAIGRYLRGAGEILESSLRELRSADRSDRR